MTKTDEVKELRTGCTLLDLVVGGGECMGFPPGKIINIVGDKSSGKTFLACEIAAANIHRLGNKFKSNYDDGESGFTFNTQKLWGVDLLTDKTLQSGKVEDFDVNVNRFLKTIQKGETGLYVLDSLDGLSDDEKDERDQKRFKAAEAGKEFKEGTYGMKTPRFLSQEFFRTKAGQFYEKEVNLLIISQVRENIDPFSFKKFNRSGGKALDFFAHTALWLATVTKIKKEGRVIGVVIKARTDKSKTPRPFRECVFSIYFDYGVDNIGSNLDYLFDLRGQDGKLKQSAEAICWSGKKINLENLKTFLVDLKLLDKAREDKKEQTKKPQLSVDWIVDWISEQKDLKPKFDKEFAVKPETRDELITRIDGNPALEKELEQRVIDKWEAHEAKIATNRKRKYS